MKLAPYDPDLATAPTVLTRFKRALNISMGAVIVLAGIFFAQGLLGDLRALSIQPQQLAGLIGIVIAPLLHGSIGHLAANAFSILVLGSLTGTVFPKATVRALPLIWLGSGLGTWLLANHGFHIGASGITHGLGFMVFTLALLRRDHPAIAAALIAFFFFGSMLLTILPQELGVSWEYHLSGALAGIASGWLWRHADPPPPRRRYSWEEEEDASSENETEVELSSPHEVPVLWQRQSEPRGVLLSFQRKPPAETTSTSPYVSCQDK